MNFKKIAIVVTIITFMVICSGCSNLSDVIPGEKSNIEHSPSSGAIKSETTSSMTNRVSPTSTTVSSSTGRTDISIPKFTLNCVKSGNIVYLYHNGGDALQKQTTGFRVNGEEIPISSVSFLHSQDWPWSSGKTVRVVYGGSGIPELVEILYTTGDIKTVAYTYKFSTSQSTPVPINTIS